MFVCDVGMAGGEQWMQMLGLGPNANANTTATAAGGSSSGAAASTSTSATMPPHAPAPLGAPTFDLSALLASSGIPPATAATPGAFNLPPPPNSAGGSLTVEDMQRAMQAGKES